MKHMLKKVLAMTLCIALGLSLVGGAFAADEPAAAPETDEPKPGTFDIGAVCTDDGQYVDSVILHLEKKMEADAEDLKDAFTVTVKGFTINFYGFIVKDNADMPRIVDGVEVSEDGMTVTVKLKYQGAELDFLNGDTLAAKSDFELHNGTYEVKVTKEVGSLNTESEFTYSGKMIDPEENKWGAVDKTDTEYNYRYFDPSENGYEMPDGGYPLIVWLHGAGESVQTVDGKPVYDNKLQITANRVTAWGQKETQDMFGGAYVIAPQMDSLKNPRGWGWNPEVVMATIEAFIKSVGEETVNRNHIVIGGCSMGGMGTWAVLQKYPKYFSAAFPTCGSVTLSATDIQNLKDLPIYLIHTVEDGTVNITGSLNAYDTLTAAGKDNIYLALYAHTWTEGTPDSTPEELAALAMNGHSSWIYVHNDFDGVKPADKYFIGEEGFTYEQNGKTTTYYNTKPSELGYKSFHAWLAGQVKQDFDLGAVCTDDGQYINSVTLHLDKPVNATGEELKDALTVTVKDFTINFYGFIVKDHEDMPRIIDDVKVSEDGKTVTIALRYQGDGINFFNGDTLAAKSDFMLHNGYYAIGVKEDVGSLTTKSRFTYSGKIIDPEENKWGAVAANNAAGTYAYRWFDPEAEGYEVPENGFPIVVWLHGAGEWGNNGDNFLQITANRVTAWGQEHTQELFGGAYVLAPQADRSNSNPDLRGWNGKSVVATIEALIKSVGEEKVDRNHIVIGGCSAGGMGTWNVIKEYPHYFSAAFPTCGSVSLSGEDLINLMQLPIYLIHTVEDQTVNITGSLNAYDTMKAAGKENIYLALYEHTWTVGTPDETEDDLAALAANGHSSWIYVHNDFDGEKDADKYFIKDGFEYGGKTYYNTKPSEFDCTSFHDWLAHQVNPEVNYTRYREVVAFGEIVRSVTIHGLDLDPTDELPDIEVTVKDFTNIATQETSDVVRKDGEAVINEDGSVTVTYPTGKAFTENGASYKYVVTVDGKKIPFAYDECETAKFGAVTYRTPEYSFYGTKMGSMSGRYFVPDKDTYKNEDGYPLVVWLHGVGECGTDNRLPISANDVPAWTEQPTQDIFGGAYILAIQNHASAGEGAPAATKSVIDQFIKQMGDIDLSRVYIGGCSYGGIGTWQMLRNYPNFFAAGFPICCGPSPALTDEEVESLVNTPIYMTVSTGDSAGIVSGMIEAYNKLTEAGNENVHIAMFEHSLYEGSEDLTAAGVYIDHWSWTYVHADYDGLGDDYDGQMFIDCSKDGEYNDGATVVKDGVLTYTWNTTDKDGKVTGTESITLNGKTERPKDTGYDTFKTWIAAQAKPVTPFSLETVCTDDGQYVRAIILTFEEPVGASAEELKDAFTVTVKDMNRNFYGTEVKGDFKREITGVTVSKDGLTVRLDLAYAGIDFVVGLASRSDYASYGGRYEVKAAKTVGTLNPDSVLRYSGETTDPVADVWGAVELSRENGTYAYRWFDPSGDYKMPKDGYPLVVWLHGAGETGTDNNLQITANRVTAWGLPETQDLFKGAYVLAPQSNSAVGSGWGWTPENVMKTIEAFIDMVGEKNVNRNHIVIGGCSMGGMGTWSTIKAYPDFFSAAFPTCGSVTLSEEDVKNLMDLPIYLIHTVEDGTVNITGSLNAYDTLTAAGKKNIYLALYEHTWTIGTPDTTPEDLLFLSYNGHSSWIYVHNDFDGEKAADKYFIGEKGFTYQPTGKTYYNTKPKDLGYSSFKAWLAGQVKGAEEPVTPAPSRPSNPPKPLPPIPAAKTASDTFDDVVKGAWYEEYVNKVYDESLMVGFSDTEFGIDRNLERGQLAMIIYRLAKQPAFEGENPFTDVPDFYYTTAIKWASANGIVNGYTDGTFRPGSDIKREELVTMLWRYAKFAGYDVSTDGFDMPEFTDIESVSDYAVEAMRWAVQAGIINGYTDNTLKPSNTALRQEIAKMISVFLSLPMPRDASAK